MAAHAHHDHDHHANNQHDGGGGIDGLRDFVPGAQQLIVALPLVGDLQVFAIAAGLVAQDGDLDAISGVVQVEIALLPGEAAVDAVGASDVALFHEIQRRGVAADGGAQKILGDGAGLLRGGTGAGGVFGQFVVEAGELAARRDVDGELFLLQRDGTSDSSTATGGRGCP